jgi:hypothetical protein
LQGEVGTLDAAVAGQEFDVVAHPVVDLHRAVVQLRGLGADGGGELDVFGLGQVGGRGGGGGRGVGEGAAGEAAVDVGLLDLTPSRSLA